MSFIATKQNLGYQTSDRVSALNFKYETLEKFKTFSCGWKVFDILELTFNNKYSILRDGPNGETDLYVYNKETCGVIKLVIHRFSIHIYTNDKADLTILARLMNKIEYLRSELQHS